MGALFWSEEEKTCLLNFIVPKSCYCTGVYVKDSGLSFEELAPIMQAEMDRRGTARRQYTPHLLFQQYYQRIASRTKGRGEDYASQPEASSRAAVDAMTRAGYSLTSPHDLFVPDGMNTSTGPIRGSAARSKRFMPSDEASPSKRVRRTSNMDPIDEDDAPRARDRAAARGNRSDRDRRPTQDRPSVRRGSSSQVDKATQTDGRDRHSTQDGPSVRRGHSPQVDMATQTGHYANTGFPAEPDDISSASPSDQARRWVQTARATAIAAADVRGLSQEEMDEIDASMEETYEHVNMPEDVRAFLRRCDERRCDLDDRVRDGKAVRRTRPDA